MAGLVTVTLQIAYLPALYAAFNRRENEIALLNSRAGSPSWGPELLARTHYALAWLVRALAWASGVLRLGLLTLRGVLIPGVEGNRPPA
jgi:hypothetical protein